MDRLFIDLHCVIIHPPHSLYPRPHALRIWNNLRHCRAGFQSTFRIYRPFIFWSRCLFCNGGLYCRYDCEVPSSSLFPRDIDSSSPLLFNGTLHHLRFCLRKAYKDLFFHPHPLSFHAPLRFVIQTLSHYGGVRRTSCPPSHSVWHVIQGNQET